MSILQTTIPNVLRCFRMSPLRQIARLAHTDPTCDKKYSIECFPELMEKNCIVDMCSLPPNTPQPCVIIIGAGLAGLSAANRLVQCGITNFRVLEASDRPGGRVKSCWLGDSMVEMGSEFITGASIANPVYTMAAQEKLIKAPLLRTQQGGGIFFTSDGRAIDTSIAAQVMKAFNNIKAKASKSETPSSKQSLSEYLDTLIMEEVQKLPEIQRFDATRAFYGLSNDMKSDIGEDLSKVSSSFFSAKTHLPGGNVRIPLGMGSLMVPLIKSLPECSLVLCKPVHCIRWGAAGDCGPRAIVRCCDGEEYPADYVIVTVPLGVLKSKANTMFCPNLPGFKMEAVNKVGFGHIGRIFLEQQPPFWAGETKFNFAWSPQELKQKSSWIRGLSGFSGVAGSSKVLVATVSGPEAKMMEQQSDEAVVKDLTKLLRTFLNDPSLPPPKEIMRSDWSTNPHYFGSLTFLGLDSNVGHIHDLAEPLPGECDEVPPIIYFAGEHTSPKYFSTLHGARESGIREADRILALTRKMNGPPYPCPCSPCITEA